MVKYVLLSLGMVGLLMLGQGLGLQSSWPTSQQERFVVRVPQDFPTIQAAIDAVADGGTVLIGPGLYKENIQITKSIRLVGAGQERVQIQGNDNSKDPIISFFSRATLQVYIRDLTIGDPTFPIEQVAPAPTNLKLSGIGLWILFASVQMILKRVTLGGLALGVSGSGRIYENGISFPSQIILEEVNLVRNGIGLFSEANLLVIRSKIEENLIGIAAEHLSLYQSSVSKNRFGGISLGRAINPLVKPESLGSITENEFRENGVAIHLVSMIEGDWVTIGYNRFIQNKQYGIVIEDPACPTYPELLPPKPIVKSAPIQIIGGGNEFQNNGQDLCHADYPWPPGFRR